MLHNTDQILQKVISLKKEYDKGNIPRLKTHEVHPELPPDDRLNYLYFTLPVSLNFQRSSPAMWRSALETFNDPNTNYLFYPEKSLKEDREKVQADLVKHRLALQRNRHTDIWLKISLAFNQLFENDPRVFLNQYEYDADRIVQTLSKDLKQNFPYLGGPKMSNYWMLILMKFTDARFDNTDKISIIPDTHVRQASEVLGIARSDDTAENIANAWFELLKGSDITPVEMHSVLWNWSRANFKPEV